MGAITPIVSGLGTLASTAGTINQIVNTAQSFGGHSPTKREQDLALQQLQARQQLAQQQSAARSALDQERLSASAKAVESDRQRALRRAVARSRAKFGGQGISTNSGSAQAILLGLFDESEEEHTQRTNIDNLRGRAIDLDLSNQSGLNVLQRTQLQERQNLAQSIDSFGGLF